MKNIPIQDFERPYYKEVELIPEIKDEQGNIIAQAIMYHMPKFKLGQGMYTRAQQYQREYSINQLVAAHGPTPKDAPVFVPEASEIDAYFKANASTDGMQQAFVSSLLRPIGEQPDISTIWDFIPMQVVSELGDFFLQSLREFNASTRSNMLNSIDKPEDRKALEQVLNGPTTSPQPTPTNT